MTRRGWMLFAAMGVIWGIPYLLIKVADQGVAVPVLVLCRTGVGTLILLPLAARGNALRVVRGYLPWIAVFAVFEVIAPWWFLSDAERRLSSSMSALIIAAVPVIGAIAAVATGSDRLSGIRWVGLAIGMGGVVLLVGTKTGGGIWPVVEVLVTAVGYATAPMIADRKLRDVPSLQLTAVTLGLAAVVYLVPGLLSMPDHVPSAKTLGALVALAVICTAAALLLFFELIREVGPSRGVVITYVNPAVAVALGVAVLGEPLTVSIAASFVLILGGSVLATRRSAPAPAAAPVEQDAAAPAGAAELAAAEEG